jgi:hypothetical protein
MTKQIRAGNPHGKPRIELQRVQLRLSEEHITTAKSIGLGSISEGIRTALDRANEKPAKAGQ